VLVAEPILPNLEADEDSEMLRMTAEFTAALERHIRATPTQWVWFHDRWRHKPGDRIQVRSAGKKVVQT
jgi:lauroyl/myristoyl acyltransferase